MIKAIIFDYDGVLVDSRDTGKEAFEAIAQYLGAPGFASLREFQRSQVRYEDFFEQWGASGEKREHTQKIYRSVTSKKQINLIPGIKTFLEQLSKKYTLAIVSGTYRELIEPTLKRHDMLNYFSTIITKDDVERSKPDPEGMHLCLKRLDIRKDEALFVGDMTMDIEMGRSSGVKTAIISSFSWNTIEDLKQFKPDVLLEKPQDILQELP
ncbi:HAD family hydrolase [Candidatus Woesearchaeota archaeon]|nr:HAD family hydrolase [Candidatus Woesearchaeota archaeon]